VDPTQPNPWVNPTHGQLWSLVSTRAFSVPTPTSARGRPSCRERTQHAHSSWINEFPRCVVSGPKYRVSRATRDEQFVNVLVLRPGARFTKYLYLRTILRLSYVNAKVMIGLRRRSNLQNIFTKNARLYWVRFTCKIVRSSSSHHIAEIDAGLDRPLYPRNKLYDKILTSQRSSETMFVN